LVGVLPFLLKNPLDFLSQSAARHPGAVVALRFGRQRAYLVTHPDHVEHVCAKNGRNYTKQDFFRRRVQPLFGDGLITSDGETWARSRRLMQPSFRPSDLARYGDLMVAAVDEELAQWKDDGPSDFFARMLILVQKILLRAIFSSSIGPNEMAAIHGAVAGGLKTASRAMFFPDGFPVPGTKAAQRHRQTIDDILLPLIRQHRAEPEKYDDLLSRLVGVGDDSEAPAEPLTEQQVRDEVLDLMIVGTDTTAVTLTWLFYRLALHSEVDQKVREELDTVLANRSPTFSELRQLTYMKRVISEVLRLYPPGWVIPKSTHEGDSIGGYAIEANATVILCPYVTQRMPEFWQRPLDFDPSRFSEAQSQARHRFSYYPFGGGPRLCIGNHFSFMEMQIIAAMLAQRFRPRLAKQPIEVSWAGTLPPRGGMPMFLGSVR
jgi:cytochrome P450